MAHDAKLDAALKQYGYLGSLANSVPELKGLLGKAINGTWSNDEFSRALQDSHWWKSQAESVRQNQILKVTDPGTWKDKRGQLANKVRLLGAEIGVSLTEGGGGSLAHVVDAAMAGGWDESRLRQEIGGYFKWTRGHDAGGTAGQTMQQLRKTWSDQGVMISQDAVASYTKSILRGKSTLASYQTQALEAAKSKYAGFTTQLNEGMTMRDLSEPYRQSMSALLEIPVDKVDFREAQMQRALTARNTTSGGPAGAYTPMPLWQFEQNLRADPRRDKTKGATNEAYDVLNQIGKEWGYA